MFSVPYLTVNDALGEKTLRKWTLKMQALKQNEKKIKARFFVNLKIFTQILNLALEAAISPPSKDKNMAKLLSISSNHLI